MSGSEPWGDVRTWGTDLFENLGKLVQDSFILGDLLEVLSGKEDGDVRDIGTLINTMISDTRKTIDAIVKNLFNWDGNGFTLGNLEGSVADQAATTAALSAAVATLQSVQDNYGSGGISAVVDFSSRANASTLGSDFSQTYSGPGSTTWGISGGRTAVTVVNDDYRTCLARYNVAPTTSDYQIVMSAFAGSPEWFNNTAKGHNLFLGRMNAAGTEFVYADLDKYWFELGCVAGGVKTIFHLETGGFSFKGNGIYSLRLGTPGSPRIFQVMEGSLPLYTHVEVGTTSMLGATHRHAGMGETTYASGLGAQRPAPVGAWAYGDNLPPSVPGSGFTMYRASTTPVKVVSGGSVMPANFYDTPGSASSDFIMNLTDASVVVEYAGHYQFEVQAEVAGIFFPDIFRWFIYVNSIPRYYGGTSHMRGLTSTAVSLVPACVSATFANVELGPGDEVRLGYYASNTVSSVLTGDAGLFGTRFAGALTNRSFS